MKKIIWLCAMFSLVLSGCGTQRIKERQAKFEEKNNQLIGKTYDDLIRGSGVPTGEAKLSDGSRIVEYSSSHITISGGGSYPVPISTYVPNRSGVGGFWIYSEMERNIPVSSSTYYCKLDFTVSTQNIIQSWKAEGNHCY